MNSYFIFMMKVRRVISTWQPDFVAVYNFQTKKSRIPVVRFLYFFRKYHDKCINFKSAGKAPKSAHSVI